MSKLQLGMTYRDINVPFPTTLEQRSKLHRFAIEMLNSDLKPEFVDRVVEYAREDQGMYEIIELWSNEVSGSDEEAALEASMSDFLRGSTSE